MEVIPLIRSSAAGSEASSKGDNGIKRRVQEWSRLDRLTGILEHARVEADQWTNHTANSKHKYGKVVDRRARNLADGSKEETQQTKQLEVFQTHTAGCSVQVIRSQTSTTSSWHNSSQAGSSAFQWPSSIFDKKDNQFDQLRLEYSPLDVSSQKSKATVGRSGSISARRPPTRRPAALAVPVQVTEIESVVDSSSDARTMRETSGNDDDESVASWTNLNRLKSCSNDEIRSDGVNETDEPLLMLDRSSRFRRSLQFAQSPKQHAMDQDRGKATVGELEDVLKKVLGKKLRQAVNGRGDDAAANTTGFDERSWTIRPAAASSKKPSFVTVENLKRTKNNLRHLNGSSPLDADDNNNKGDDDDDDGIETDEKPPRCDSRSLDYRGSALQAKSEEWYNRRKSYGFEKVQQTCASSAVDSSTDSGICRSTDNGLSNSSRQSSVDRESIADLVKKYSGNEINNNGAHAHAYNTTVVAKGKILEAINSLRSKSSAYFDVVKSAEAVSKENDDGDKEQVYNARRLSVGTEKKFDKDDYPKRHSIAVVSETADKRNGNKKVEFCRTEVHFDTTPGKINIVDMDDKPAHGQLYRPKKRYNRPSEKSHHGLPEYRFGDDVQQQQQRRQHDDDDDDDDDDGAHALQTNGGAIGERDDADTNAGLTTVGDAVAGNRPKSILKRQQRNADSGGGGGGGVACDNGIEVRISSTESTPVDCRRASWSVADRVKQVEAVGFSTRVNFTEGGQTTAVGFDPADPRAHRYSSYNGGTASSPVWYQNDGGSPAATDTSAKCHEKLLVRIGSCNGTVTATGVKTDLRAFSKCFGNGSGDEAAAAAERLSSTSLVMNTAGKFRTEQPSAYMEEMNRRTHGRFQKTASTSWPRYGHKTYPVTAAARKYDLLKTRYADVKRDGAAAAAAAAHGMPDVIGALDDLSKTIDEQIGGAPRRSNRDADRHVTLIEVRQACDEDTVVHGDRLEYVKDLMSTDETSEESLKADEEVRSYMAAAAADCTNEDDVGTPACENTKKLVSAVKNNVEQSCCSQDNRQKKFDVKSYESTTLVVPNVTSVLLNHEKSLEPERSQFQPVQAAQVTTTRVSKHQFDEAAVRQKQPSSKRVPVKIVQDNRKIKQKTEMSKTEVPAAITKMCATVSLKQVPMTVQPKPACNERKKPEKKESIYGNVGYRGSLRIKDKPAATNNNNKQVQDLFNTGRDSWLNMPKDLGPKLNRSKVTTHKSRSRKETAVDSAEVSVLEELNKAADEILKAVDGYTDDDGDESKTGPDHTEAKLKNKKKAARLLQRANSREALLHLDGVSSSDEEAADGAQRVKPPKIQRKTKAQQHAANNSVATKTTASFAKKIQSRTQNVTKTNVNHKVHPTYYGNVSSYSTQPSMKFRDKPQESMAKQVVEQKDTKGRYQCKITAKTFNTKKTKSSVEENKNSIKGC